MSKVAVLGAGAWGTALAKLLAEKGNSVVVWAHEPEVAASIRDGHENTRYFAGFKLPDNLTSTTSAEEALRDADMVLLVVPSHVTREVLTQVGRFIPPGVPVVSATKGIENDTLCLMHEVFGQVMGAAEVSRYVALSGPSFAKEVALHHPTVVVIGGHDPKIVERVQLEFFSEGVFRAYGSEDLTGVEMGGALKNVIAIAAGAADGLGFGYNTRAALITRGLAEIAKLAVAKGANPLTMAGLAGMGDLVLTCTGELSRNRTIGFALGQGKRLEDAIRELGHVAEGVKTAESARDLARKMGVEMPIVEQTYGVLYEGKSAREAMNELMVRPARREMHFLAMPKATLACLGPVVGRETRLVILGSFPGEASLAAQQYYAHPRNHFWRILSGIWGEDLVSLPYPARLDALRARRVGLWDVYASCNRQGSLDSAIRDAVPNPLGRLLEAAPSLVAVAHNGGESARSMKLTRALGVAVHRLPSSSPANASWSLARKIDAWRVVLDEVGVTRWPGSG